MLEFEAEMLEFMFLYGKWSNVVFEDGSITDTGTIATGSQYTYSNYAYSMYKRRRFEGVILRR